MFALPLAAPALPLHEAGKYVAGAYIVFLVLLAIYVAIMATKLARIDRELGELADLAENREPGQAPSVRTRGQHGSAGGEAALGLQADPAAPGRGAEEAAGSYSEQPTGGGL